MDRIMYFVNLGSNKNDLKYILFIYIFIILFSIIPGQAAEIINPHNNTSGNNDCKNCHFDEYAASFQQKQIPQTNNPIQTIAQINNLNTISVSQDNSQTLAATSVAGNITLITSMGQDWYQQGIYGLSSNASPDQSWGWTFFDENPPSGFIVPSEKITQKNNIYALLLDDGNNSSPISAANVVANVTYWIYNGTDYASKIISVQLTEDINRNGFYNGNFSFYGGTSYKTINRMNNCDGCHPTGYGHTGFQDNLAGYFPGNYSVSIKAEADNKIKTVETNFEVTPWGCEDCHGSGNQHNYSRFVDSDSACYVCHSDTQIGYHNIYKAGNPHQNTAHREIQCTSCHTNKSINSQTFNGVTFVDEKPQYDYDVVQLNAGTHLNLTCRDCHGDLTLSDPQGGYKSDNYTINNIINRYDLSFTSVQQFQDYYVVNVIQGDPLNISFDWEGTSNLGFYLYPPNFNPRNLTGRPYNNGATNSKPENYTNATPMSGKWILSPYGYNLSTRSGMVPLFGTLQSPINYSINSTYPIEQKNLPLIPECNNCHNSSASGGAYTADEIPNWNPGFAHVDTNNDGSPDIQCRMCHDAMHSITIKDCQNCHTTAPVNHPIKEPVFTQYTPAQCLACHGDPHKVTAAGGTDCISCHAPGDVNTSKFARHANINTSDGSGIVTNNDCWTCHYQKDMNRSHVYLCDSCHKNSSGVVKVNDPSLIVGTLTHASNTCKSCHAPDTYHVQGTVGPLGRVENPGWQLISAIDKTGCHDCHRTHNGLDEPFHGPGIGSPGTRHIATNSRNNGSDCSSTCHASNTNPHRVTSSTNGLKPTLSTPVLSPSTGNSVEVTATGSSESPSASLQIEAAQYRIYNSIGQTIVDWTAMNAKDGRYNSSNETVNATISTMGFPEGTYTVSVRVMASGPRTNTAIRYCPLNGDWSAPLNATLIIQPPNGFINGTVSDSLSGSGIPGVTVLTNTGAYAVTDNTGFYSLGLTNGTYTLAAFKAPEFSPNNTIPTVTVVTPATVIQDIILTKKPTGTISGVITNGE